MELPKEAYQKYKARNQEKVSAPLALPLLQSVKSSTLLRLDDHHLAPQRLDWKKKLNLPTCTSAFSSPKLCFHFFSIPFLGSSPFF